MPSAGLLEQARRGRYRAVPPVVPVPDGVEQLQSQLSLAQLDPSEFQSVEELPDPPAMLDRRPAAARADSPPRPADIQQSRQHASGVARGEAAGGAAAPSPALRRQADVKGEALATAAPAPGASPKFGGFRIPGMPGIVKSGGTAIEGAAPQASSSPPDHRASAHGLHSSAPLARPLPTSAGAEAAASDSTKGGQVVANRHAAGVLTRLVSAVVEGAGGRPATAGEPNKQTLAALITEAHRVSLELTAAAAGETPARRSLQATMLKETAFALARHYNRTGEVAADAFRQVAQEVLDAGATLVSQEIIDLLAQTSPDYGSYESELQYAEDRLRAASFDIAWDVQRSLEDPRLHYGRFFDLGAGSQDADRPFTYGQPLGSVRDRLLQSVRRVVEQAQPDISSPLMMAKWREGALSRASSLLCATYRTETVNLLRTEATPDLLGRARANALGRTFESVVASAERKAAAQFNEIERSAPELMRLGERLQEPNQDAPRPVAQVMDRDRS